MNTVTMNTKQPLGAKVMFGLQLLGMIGFSIIFSLLVLYCTNKLQFSDTHAFAIVSAFNALVFSMSVPGGYLAERFLGFRYAVNLSIVLCALGMFVLATPFALSIYLGLAIVIVGTGMIVPAMFVLLGRVYKKNDARREGGFMLAYIGMNVGALIASANSGTLSELISYSSVFIIGGVTSLLMLPLLYKYRNLFDQTESTKSAGPHYTITSQTKTRGLLITLASIVPVALMMHYAAITDVLMVCLSGAAIILVCVIAVEQPKIAKQKLLIFLALTLVSIVFWTLYQLAPSVVALFTERNIDRHLFGILIPAADFSSLNPFFIVTMGPLLTLLWLRLKRRNINVSIPFKFSLALMLMGCGYLVLVMGIAGHNAAGYVAIGWIVLSYFLQTVGELMIGPVGYSMVGQLVPAKHEGLMLGIWQLAVGFAGALSGFLADLTVTKSAVIKPLITNVVYSHSFELFGGVTVVVGIIVLMMAKKLTQLGRFK